MKVFTHAWGLNGLKSPYQCVHNKRTSYSFFLNIFTTETLYSLALSLSVDALDWKVSVDDFPPKVSMLYDICAFLYWLYACLIKAVFTFV